jgi:hypothetical protein
MITFRRESLEATALRFADVVSIVELRDGVRPALTWLSRSSSAVVAIADYASSYYGACV